MTFFAQNSCDGAYSSLDVRFTKQCDNNCSFCVEKTGIKQLNLAEPYILAQKTIESGIQDVLILGGEPFLDPKRLYDYVKLIRPFVKTIYVTTSLPKIIERPKTIHDNKVDGPWAMFLKILELIDGLNISIQSVDPIENNKILNASSDHDRIEMFKYTCLIDPLHKVRACINLNKNGINSKEKLFHALNVIIKTGCNNIKINELQHSEELYVSFENIMGIKLPSPYSHGCQTKIIAENFPHSKDDRCADEVIPHRNGFGQDVNIIVKRSCFLVENSRKATIMDLGKAIWKRIKSKIGIKNKNNFAVLYENGELKTGWLKEN